MSCTLVNETCPAAVSTVNMITNSFNLGTGDVDFIHEEPSKNGSVLTLASFPAANTLRIFKNGQCLVETADYTVADLDVTLVVAPTADDVFVADYLPQPA